MAGRRKKHRARVDETYSEYQSGDWPVCVVCWSRTPPEIEVWRTDHLTPAERERAAWWLMTEWKARVPDLQAISHDVAYCLLFG